MRELLPAYRTNPWITVYETETPGLIYQYLSFNVNLINLTWRKAMSYAINYTYIIEKMSGQLYEAFMQEQIFKPLGMNDTGCDKNSMILKNRASGYTIEEENGNIANAWYSDMSWPSGAGNLYSTVEDLFIWDQALRTEKLCSKESIEKNLSSIWRDDMIYGLDVPTLTGAILKAKENQVRL